MLPLRRQLFNRSEEEMMQELGLHDVFHYEGLKPDCTSYITGFGGRSWHDSDF